MHRRLLSLWVTGALLLPLCWASQEEYEFTEGDDLDNVTPTPDYDYDATFVYGFIYTSEEPDYSEFTFPGDNKTEIGNKTSRLFEQEKAPSGVGETFSISSSCTAENTRYSGLGTKKKVEQLLDFGLKWIKHCMKYSTS
ncbi:hypothetical protein UPYG_G00155210 [Umbra pygmaea]|uniref:Uncharacterized protein n=1 Tax=Umbra pygmaea TaxID=75934 RepID=A0ABD0WYG1_UMBPY